MNHFKTVNLEVGMPTVEEARKKLAMELLKAKQEGIICLKIIHGYGSTGVGGKLKVALRKSLSIRMKEGQIKGFVPGENWSVFENSTRKILEACPEISRDSDLENFNQGITLVLL